MFFNKKSLPLFRWAGEFAIVVIGVLVALAVDNYREDLQNREKEKLYLSNLILDIQGDKKRLLRSINLNKDSLVQIESLILMSGFDLENLAISEKVRNHGFNRESLDISTVTYSYGEKFTGWPAGSFNYFEPHKPTYSTLLATGDLRIFESESLKRLITNYYERVQSNNRDGAVFLHNIQQLNQYLAQSGINTYNAEEVKNIPNLKRALPYLTTARDSQHWWYSRKLIMLESLEELLSHLNNEIGVN